MGLLKRRIIEAMEPKEEPQMDARESLMAAVYAGGVDAVAAVENYLEARGEILNDITNVFARQRWIPVSERLPDDETELLVAFDDRSLGVAFAVFHEHGLGDVHLDENERPKWTDGNGVELKEPTHWMSLPEPPEVT